MRLTKAEMRQVMQSYCPKKSTGLDLKAFVRVVQHGCAGDMIAGPSQHSLELIFNHVCPALKAGAGKMDVTALDTALDAVASKCAFAVPVANARDAIDDAIRKAVAAGGSSKTAPSSSGRDATPSSRPPAASAAGAKNPMLAQHAKQKAGESERLASGRDPSGRQRSAKDQEERDRRAAAAEAEVRSRPRPRAVPEKVVVVPADARAGRSAPPKRLTAEEDGWLASRGEQSPPASRSASGSSVTNPNSNSNTNPPPPPPQPNKSSSLRPSSYKPIQIYASSGSSSSESDDGGDLQDDFYRDGVKDKQLRHQHHDHFETTAEMSKHQSAISDVVSSAYEDRRAKDAKRKAKVRGMGAGAVHLKKFGFTSPDRKAAVPDTAGGEGGDGQSGASRRKRKLRIACHALSTDRMIRSTVASVAHEHDATQAQAEHLMLVLGVSSSDGPNADKIFPFASLEKAVMVQLGRMPTSIELQLVDDEFRMEPEKGAAAGAAVPGDALSLDDLFDMIQFMKSAEFVRASVGAAFAIFDKDGNGTIDRAELMDVMSRSGSHKMDTVEEASLNAIFEMADLNKDGRLDLEEFTALAMQSKQLISGALVTEQTAHTLVQNIAMDPADLKLKLSQPGIRDTVADVDKDKQTVAHKAASAGNAAACTLLCADTQFRGLGLLFAADRKGKTPLFCAAAGGHVGTIKALLDAARSGLEHTAKKQERASDMWASDGNKDGGSLTIGERRRNASMAIMDQGRRDNLAKREKQFEGILHTEDLMKSTALHLAVTFGQPEATQALLDAGSDIEHENTFGQTPIHAACRSGRANCVGVLIRSGCNIQKESSQGKNALNLAAKGGSVACIRCVLHAYERLPLAKLAFKPSLAKQGAGSKEQLALVVAEALKQVDSKGRTPLHAACRFGHAAAVHLMLEMGAEINGIASPGIRECPHATPLHYAVFSGMVSVVELLVSPPWSIHIDPNLEDGDGEPPIFKSLYHAYTESDNNGSLSPPSPPLVGELNRIVDQVHSSVEHDPFGIGIKKCRVLWEALKRHPGLNWHYENRRGETVQRLAKSHHRINLVNWFEENIK